MEYVEEDAERFKGGDVQRCGVEGVGGGSTVRRLLDRLSFVIEVRLSRFSTTLISLSLRFNTVSPAGV